MCKAQGLSSYSCSSLCNNLQTLYTWHKCNVDHIWNSYETCIQIKWQYTAKFLTRRNSHQAYITTPKSKEWLIEICVENVIGGSLLGFYIFKGKRIKEDDIKHCKQRTCIVMQTKHGWLLSKDFFSFFKRSISRGMSQSNWHLLVLYIHGSHVTLEAIKQAHEFGLDMVTLPFHTSHAPQILDVNFFKPFQKLNKN